MSIRHDLGDIPTDILDEIEALALRVTQGVPAYRALKIVLSSAEWQQIEPELRIYFPAQFETTNTIGENAEIASSDNAVSNTSSAASMAALAEESRPPYYAVKTLARLRKLSECRAILELAKATDLLSEAGYRRLLVEIGDLEISPPSMNDKSSSAIDDTPKIEWDRESCELRLNGDVIKRTRGRNVAKNLVKVLDSFQEEGWPRCIMDPLPPSIELSKRMHDTVASLNRDLGGLRFHADGTGEKICWKLAPLP